MDRLKIEVSATTHLYRNFPASDVIRSATNNPDNYMVARVSADVWRSRGTTTSLFAEVQKSLDKNGSVDSKMRGVA